jgi:RNA polymerase sigma factor (sigma-70 family)
MSMDALTAQMLADAKANDMTAITEIVTMTEPWIQSLARKAAPATHEAETREDLAQVGRIAVWEAVSRFDGTDPAQFGAFLRNTISGQMSVARQKETRQGVSRDVAAKFERAISLAAGDPYAAEKLAQDKAAMGDRPMSAEMAYAARISWMGLDSLDRPVGGSEGSYTSLGEFLADTLGITDEMVTAEDIARHKRTQTKRAVHRTLGKLSDRRRDILAADHGIDATIYTGGPDVSDAELGAQMGITAANVKATRTKAMTQFRALYLAGASL